jgi:CheY-like chemotaxis protein
MSKVLIIDDDPVYADMTRQRMERAGYRVDVHIGPFGATAAIGDNAYDLVILDVFMPGLAGPDLLSIIRKSEAGAHTRVLLCSSMDPAPLARVAEEHGANGAISKAAGRFEFLQAVDQALAK